MAAGSTYTPIATQTLSSSVSNITFSSISGIYTDLILIVNIAETPSIGSFVFRVNGDSGNNYSVISDSFYFN